MDTLIDQDGLSLVAYVWHPRLYVPERETEIIRHACGL